ncbi:MAG: MFS transporter [Lewinella sp.]|nr:MFS transporter [Lewinella sp.]
MHRFWAFLRTHPRLLLFGTLLTFFSSYGQTFLISLYIPAIEQFFGFTNTGLSSLYAVATMASAFSLPWIGRLLDTAPLRRFTLWVVAGLSAACLTLSAAVHPGLVLLGFFGLRLCGQGLMSHTAISTMARAFEADRGKAISIAMLGHPLGEATLPLIVTLLVGAWGWRGSLQWSALSLVVLVAPLVVWLLRSQPAVLLFPKQATDEVQPKAPNPLRVLTQRAFWVIAPAIFITGFLNTALFFYQFKLGDSRGWEPTWVALSLSIYAIASALSLLSSGPLVDQLSARRLFPFILLSYTLGFLVLALVKHPLSYPAALVLIAISNGGGGTIKNSVYAEVFGTALIGTVRSVFTTVTVFSTALGPLFFGLLLDAGWTYGQTFLLCVGVLVGIIAWSFMLWRLPAAEGRG